MPFTNICFEVKDGGIGLLIINRPEVMNAFNGKTFGELNILLEQIEAGKNLRVLIVTGAGKAFAAGADLAEITDDGIEENRAYARLGQSVWNRLEALPIPTIAAVNGYALGGGCELALACDIRIAGNKAAFGLPEVKLGVIPCFGGTQRLPLLVGVGRAKELIFTGRIVRAEEALSMGLVEQLVDSEELLGTALKMAGTMARNSPTGIRYAKIAVDKGRAMHLADGLELEKDLSAICYGLPDKTEGIKAFLEKRDPVFINS